MNGGKGSAFVDTNILVYAFQQTPDWRQSTARKLVDQLVDEDRIRISTQVLQEFFVAVTRKARTAAPVKEALDHLEDFASWPLFLVDYDAIREAAMCSHHAMISFWDALLVVAASHSGAATLYTEDLNEGQEILGVRVVNPFRN